MKKYNKTIGLENLFIAQSVGGANSLRPQVEFNDFAKGESPASRRSRSSEERSYMRKANISYNQRNGIAVSYTQDDGEFDAMTTTLAVHESMDDVVQKAEVEVALEGLQRHLEQAYRPDNAMIYDGSEPARTAQEHVTEARHPADQNHK